MYYIELLNSSVISKQTLTTDVLRHFLKVKAEQHQGCCNTLSLSKAAGMKLHH